MISPQGCEPPSATIVFKAGTIGTDLSRLFHKGSELPAAAGTRDLVRAVFIVKRLTVFTPHDLGKTPCTQVFDHVFVVDVHIQFLPTPIPHSPVDGLITLLEL